MEATEKNSLTLALMEERSHFSILINCLNPVMEHKIAMISEVEQLKEIMESLSKFAVRPSSVSEEIQENTNKYLPTNSTIERKKRALKEDIDCDSTSTSSHYKNPSLEALNLCSASSSESSLGHRSLLPSSVSVDRSHTISYGHYQSKLRPNLGFDVCSQQNRVCALPKQESPYAVPSTLPSSVQTNGPRVVDKIYSRPALIMNKENGSTLKRVMTPTVPNLDIPTFKTEGANPAGMKVGQNFSKSDSTNASVEMSLADALRDLKESAAQLQFPYESFGAPSCQSLQCSSGYGTMTNVSASSVETVSSNQTDLDALANTLMESCNFPDLDKYSTLPNKHQIQGSFPRELKRPASTAGFQPVSAANESLNEVKGIPSFPAAYSANHIYSSTCAKGVPMLLQHRDADILPRLVGNQTPNHLSVSVEEDDLDDLPLPPPPEELGYSAANPVLLRKSSEPQQLLAHTGVMQSLNAKLSAMRSSAYDNGRPYYGDAQRSSSLAQQNSDKTGIPGTRRTIFRQECLPQDDGSGTDDFEHVIQRGVKLRHTICNDRSAPRLMRH